MTFSLFYGFSSIRSRACICPNVELCLGSHVSCRICNFWINGPIHKIQPAKYRYRVGHMFWRDKNNHISDNAFALAKKFFGWNIHTFNGILAPNNFSTKPFPFFVIHYNTLQGERSFCTHLSLVWIKAHWGDLVCRCPDRGEKQLSKLHKIWHICVIY